MLTTLFKWYKKIALDIPEANSIDTPTNETNSGQLGIKNTSKIHISSELTPEERADLWQAGMLDVDAYNKNPKKYEEELKNLVLVPFGDTKIGPNHPHYDEAKKYWEAFNERDVSG